MNDTIPIDGLAARTGTEIGVSDWFDIDQESVNAFADLTEDHQFIHVDPERAHRESPFGGTIAHGFFSLSLLSAMSQQALPRIRDRAIGINYGFDRIRFLSPVPVGTRVRGRFVLEEVTPRGDGQYLTRYTVTVEIEGSDRPALVAEWLVMSVLKQGGSA